MYEDESRERRFYAVSYEEDIPQPGNGSLIPYLRPKSIIVRPERPLLRYVTLAIVPLTVLLFVVTLGTTWQRSRSCR